MSLVRTGRGGIQSVGGLCTGSDRWEKVDSRCSQPHTAAAAVVVLDA